jgi:hypothetical protein
MASKLAAFAQLLRLSLAPTVVADLAAGIALALAAPGGGPTLGRAIPAALLLFCGGMALNGFVDRDHDAQRRPSRPIPSGTIAPAVALLLALACLAAAPLVARALLPGNEAWQVAAALAVAIVAYHTPLKNNGVVGPLLLGAIRAGDLLMGAVAVAGLERGVAVAWPVAACHGLFVVGASLVAHEEDRIPRVGRARFGVVLAWSAVGANLLVVLWLGLHLGIAAFIAAFELFTMRTSLVLFRPGAPGRVPMSAFARLLLSRLPLLPMTAAFAAGADELGMISLVAFGLVFVLVRFIPPT